MQTHVDVLIAGAGISGIAAAHYLKQNCPNKTFAIVEARDAIGGTWDLFRFPGIRSDTDMYTLGYSFKPWEDADSVASGSAIRNYLREVVDEEGIEEQIEFGTRVERISFSSAENLWTVHLRDVHSDETQIVTCNFFWSCMGYYRYDAGYTPAFEGVDSFRGQVVHPQHWPEDLDYAGKKIVVIGSGATAMTLIPSLAEKAGHVTMLQRSPTYVFSGPRQDPIAAVLRFFLGAKRAFPIVRWKNVILMAMMYRLMRRFPSASRRLLMGQARKALGPRYDVETHFGPLYDPWDQRLCFVPDGDLFEAISQGRASVATDHIDRFTERGIALQSGAELDADIIVTATGLELQLFADVPIEVDGTQVALPESLIYKGVMLSGVPNAAFTLGYINSAWTLRAELSCEYVCELLQLMDAKNYARCCPVVEEDVERRPAWDLTAGYVKRAEHRLPGAGSKGPWRIHNSYLRDRATLAGPIEDGVLRFIERPVAQEREERTSAMPIAVAR